MEEVAFAPVVEAAASRAAVAWSSSTTSTAPLIVVFVVVSEMMSRAGEGGGDGSTQNAHERHLHRSQWNRAYLAWQNGKHLAAAESPLILLPLAPVGERRGAASARAFALARALALAVALGRGRGRGEDKNEEQRAEKKAHGWLQSAAPRSQTAWRRNEHFHF